MTGNLITNQEELIGLIYDAAWQPEVWQTFLDRLVTFSNARSGLLVFQHADNHVIGHTVQSGRDESLCEPASAMIASATGGRRHLSSGPVYPAHATAARQEFKHSPIDNEFFRFPGNGPDAGAVMSTEGSWSIRLDQNPQW